MDTQGDTDDNRGGYRGNKSQDRGGFAPRGAVGPVVRSGDVQANLQANYFKVVTRNVSQLYRYSLSIEIPNGGTISRRVKERIVYVLTEILRSFDSSVPVATNKHDLLVSVRPLPIGAFPLTIDIKHFDEDELQARPHPEPGSNRHGPTIYLAEIGALSCKYERLGFDSR